MIHCPICNGSLDVAFESQVLHRHEATYDYCHGCGFLRARNPRWLAEAYSSAIASIDTGLVMRNIHVARKLSKILLGVLGERGQGRYCDIAGGFGLLTRLMRDYGFDFYWSDKYCDNLMARGFEYKPELGTCYAVTAIEIMEHLEDPLGFVSEALERTKAKVFIFTTELFEGTPPAPSNWWYYSFETGQHIAFFQRRTLELMAKKLGLFFISEHGVHIFSREPIKLWRLRLALGRFGNFLTRNSRRMLVGKVMSDHQQLKQLVIPGQSPS
jgi:hypothetical protein